MRFVAVLESAQDGNGVLDVRFLHNHRLEAALESRVFFDMQPVFIEGGGADAVQFATGQRGLQQVGSVHGSISLAGADDGVQFIDKEDHAPVRLRDLLDDGFEPIFEFPAVLRAGDQGAHVERHQRLVLESLGDVSRDDAVRNPFDDGCLSDAWFADKHGIVLGAAGEDLDYPSDFGIASDDRINLPLPRERNEVLAVLLESLVLVFRILVGHLLIPRTDFSAFRTSDSSTPFTWSSRLAASSTFVSARNRCSVETNWSRIWSAWA